MPTVAAVGGVDAYYFSKGNNVPTEITSHLDSDSSVSLRSDTTIATTAAPSIAEQGSSAFCSIDENNMKSLHQRGTLHGNLESAFAGNTLAGPNFSTDITSFTKSVPLWLVLIVVACLLSILGLLYYVHARTRRSVQCVISRTKAEIPTLELRLPVSTKEYLDRVWYWYCLIEPVVSLFALITPDRVSRALDSTRSRCSQWLLAAILALLFRVVRGPPASVRLLQVSTETLATDPQLPNKPKRPTVKKALSVEVVKYENRLLVHHSVSRPHQTLPRIPYRPCALERLRAILAPQDKHMVGEDRASQTTTPRDEPRDPRTNTRRMKRTFRNALAAREKAHNEATKVLTKALDASKAELAAKQEAHEAAIKELTKSYDARKAALEKAQKAAIKDMTEAHDVTKRQLITSNEMNLENQERITELTKAHTNVTIELASANSTSKQRLERIEELEAELTKSEKALRASTAAYKQVEQKYIYERQRIANDEDGIARLEASHDRLEKENTNLDRAADEARAEAAKQRQRANDFERLSKDRQSTIKDLQKTNEDNQKRIEKLQDQLEKSNGKVSNLEENDKNSNAYIKELEANLNASKSQTSNAVVDFNFQKWRADKAVETQGELQSTLDYERQSYANNTRDLKKKVNDLKASASSSLKEWQQKQDKAVKAAQEKANSAKSAAEADIANLRRDKAVFDGKLDDATILITKLREEIEELQRRPAVEDLQKSNVGNATTQIDGSATEQSSPVESGYAKPSEPTPPPGPGLTPWSAPLTLPEPGDGDTAGPADTTATQGFSPSENEHDKPSKSPPPRTLEAAPSSRSPALRKSDKVDAARRTDITATSGSTPSENKQDRPTEPFFKFSAPPVVAPVQPVLSKTGEGDATPPANNATTQSSNPSENEHNKPSNPIFTFPPAPAVAPAPPVLSIPGTHGGAIEPHKPSASADYSTKNVDRPTPATEEQMRKRNVKTPRRLRGSGASTPAPAAAPPVLSQPDQGGAAGATDDSSVKDVAASENGTSRPPGQSMPMKQTTVPKPRPGPSIFMARPKPKPATKVAPPKPAETTDLKQSKPAASNVGAPTGSDAMDGVERDPATLMPSGVPKSYFGFTLDLSLSFRRPMSRWVRRLSAP